MEIRNITYEDVHGWMSDSINLKKGENFLVGINGCGKTTVLKMLRWLLEPNLTELCLLDHTLIKVTVHHGKYNYIISSRLDRGENKHIMSIESKDPRHDFKDIESPLYTDPKGLTELKRERFREQYSHLSPEQHELVSFNFINSELSSPVFVGLGRTLEKVDAFHEGSRGRNGNSKSRLGPLSINSHTLMRNAYNTSRRQLGDLNDDLNKKVLELSFGIMTIDIGNDDLSTEDLHEKITSLEARFSSGESGTQYSKALSSPKVKQAVASYLSDLKKLLEKGQDDILLLLNKSNFERANKMFDLFVDYETKVVNAKREIVTFLESVNLFLKDSHKELVFDINTGEPSVKLKGVKDPINLSHLSSGESQVVTLMSYFAFLAKKGVPIVVDEPELSLHVQWQSYFVKAVKLVLPEECQTIMATHSPEICGAEDVNVHPVRPH